MAHFILNLGDGDREQAAAFLHARRWPLARGQRHGGALAPGDRVLIHVGKPQCRFIGRAELASALDDAGRGGVSLTQVEHWPRGVALAAAVRAIDPTASNPSVQANAAGFRSAIVSITAGEYDAVVTLAREDPQP